MLLVKRRRATFYGVAPAKPRGRELAAEFASLIHSDSTTHKKPRSRDRGKFILILVHKIHDLQRSPLKFQPPALLTRRMSYRPALTSCFSTFQQSGVSEPLQQLFRQLKQCV